MTLLLAITAISLRAGGVSTVSAPNPTHLSPQSLAVAPFTSPPFPARHPDVPPSLPLPPSLPPTNTHSEFAHPKVCSSWVFEAFFFRGIYLFSYRTRYGDFSSRPLIIGQCSWVQRRHFFFCTNLLPSAFPFNVYVRKL